MCYLKSRGGMGFRNLQDFNLAMLAKQTWRILINPSFLVASVLKARYFPMGDILSATLGSSPSYSQRSIFNCLKVIRKGTQWRVGNGRQIHIQDDKWLPTPSTHKVITAPNNLPIYPMVSSLIDLDTKWWRVKMIRATFLSFEAEAILRIPLSHSLLEDKLTQMGNNCEEFTIKSAYHLAHCLVDAKEEVESSKGDPFKPLWKNLWLLKLPAKIKIFAWRACVNGLPTMENICTQGITTSNECPICGKELETTHHALLHCEFANLVWNFQSDVPQMIQRNKWTFHDSTISLLMIWSCSSLLPRQLGIIEIESLMQTNALTLPRFGRWQKTQLRTSMMQQPQTYSLLDLSTLAVGPFLHPVSSRSMLMGLHQTLRETPA